MTKEEFFGWIYVIGNIATFIYLTFFDDYGYTWWNWTIAISINFFLAMIWPIYWGILHWL